MATFKVGDRVRVIGQEPHPRRIIGSEGAIVGGLEMRESAQGRRAMQYLVALDGDGWPRIFLAGELAPLTPPAQDEWADTKVREVTRPVYTEPERVKEREFTQDEINKAVRKHLGRL